MAKFKQGDKVSVVLPMLELPGTAKGFPNDLLKEYAFAHDNVLTIESSDKLGWVVIKEMADKSVLYPKFKETCFVLASDTTKDKE